MHTLIIGSGLAGVTLARELRRLDPARDITLVTADDGSFYSKPNLSTAFAAGKAAHELVLTPADKLAQDLSLRLLAHTPVAGIVAADREIIHPGGRLAYDQLVLAVGASPIPLPLAGDGVAHALAVNNLDDYARLRRQLDGRQRVAIIGAGLIGCEFANDLRLGNFAVDVFDVAALPLSRLLPDTAALALRDRLTAIGVGFHLGTRLTAMLCDGQGFVLLDDKGGVFKYDVVLSAIGLRPNLALAKSAGLATRLGILTDACLRTTDPHIYALGDCIEIAGQYLPYVMPIMQGAKKLAATLAGSPQPVAYPAMPIVVKTPACPTVIAPPPAGEGHWQEEIMADGLRALYLDAASGRTSGFVLQGACTRERMALAATLPAMAP